MPAPKFRRFTYRLAAFFVLVCTAAFAQNTIHVPADQPTIQAGIDAAKNGDTVLVAPGTYYENIDFKGKAITVTSSDGAEKTIIDGSKAASPVVLMLGPFTTAPTFSGFTVQNGGLPLFGGGPEGGISLGDSSSVITTASPVIRNNIITHALCEGIESLAANPFIDANQINNTQLVPGCDSISPGAGSAIHIAGQILTAPPAVISGNIIENNTASLAYEGDTGGGGAINLLAVGTIYVQRNILRNNSSKGLGGALYIAETASLYFVGNLVYGNQGINGGLSIDIPGASTGPLTGIIANNTIAENTSVGTSTNTGSDVFIAGNLAQYAVVNNVIAGYSSGQTAFMCGTALLNEHSVTPLVFDHNDIFSISGSGNTPIGGLCTSPAGSIGNVSVDPRFVNATAAALASGLSDFHLLTGSPAIDAGNNSVPLRLGSDLDGNARVQDATGLSYPVIDMGAYEAAGLPDAQPTILTLTPATYSFTPGTSNSLPLTVTLASAAGQPTGVVTIYENGTAIGTVLIDASGTAKFPVSGLTPGIYSFVATYSGQGPFQPAVSVEFYVDVLKYYESITVRSSSNPSIVGTPVTFTVTISSSDNSIPTPINLSDVVTGNFAPVNLTPDSAGVATFTTSALALGQHVIVASNDGDTTRSGVSVVYDQFVVSAYVTSITLTSSPNPSISVQNVTFTTAVTSTNGTPTGSIQFTDNGTAIGTQTLNASGVATLSTSTLTVGTHNITATYVPTGSFAGSSTSISQTVNDVTDTINITSSLNPSTYGQPVTITAQIVSSNGTVPTGEFAFSEGSQFLGRLTVDASGNAAITLSTLSVGAHLITAAFEPSNTPHTFAGTFTQQVNGLPTSTLLTATPLTGVAHITPITLTATVAPAAPGGSTPTGQVLFYVNGAQFNLATLVNGVATYTGTLPAGTDQIYAAYVGDPNHIYDSSNSNTVSVTITAAPSALSLTSSLNPAPALTPFTVSAQLTLANGSAVGAGYPVTFTIGSGTNVRAMTDASGTATTTSTGLLPGQYLVNATFVGTTDLQPSTATSFIETVTANPTAITLTANPNPGIQNNPVTFTSTVSALAGAASPVGVITIYDSLSPSTVFTPIATLAMPSTAGSMTATFTTSALAPGTHILYAAFTPGLGFAPSQSAQFTLIIEPQSFTLTLSDPTLTIQTGHHHTETATLTSIGGLTGTFTLSCGALPQYASCTWAQSPVTLPANGTVSTSLAIDTDQLLDFVASNTRPAPNAGAPFAARFTRHEWTAMTAFTLFPLTLLVFRRRRNLRSLLPLLILAALTSTLTACGANQYPYSTTPGTYTVPVTASAPSAPGGVSPTQTVNLTLVVTR